jgi:hypothetical protein
MSAGDWSKEPASDPEPTVMAMHSVTCRESLPT